MPKNVFLINQISWVGFYFSLYHQSSLLPMNFPGPWILFLSLFFLANSENFFSSYFLLLFPLLSESPWPCVKSVVLPSGYFPTGLPCPPSVSPASWLQLLPPPQLSQRDKQAPQHNCDQNQGCCLGESLPHILPVFPRDLNSRGKASPRKVNSAPDSC